MKKDNLLFDLLIPVMFVAETLNIVPLIAFLTVIKVGIRLSRALIFAMLT